MFHGMYVPMEDVYVSYEIHVYGHGNDGCFEFCLFVGCSLSCYALCSRTRTYESDFLCNRRDPWIPSYGNAQEM